MIELISTFNVSIIGTNCYLIKDKDSGELAVVDPGGKSVSLLEAIEKNGGNLKYIILTHGHFDHIGYADTLRSICGGKIVISREDSAFTRENELNLSCEVRRPLEPFEADILLDDNDEIKLGNSTITMLLTPGHTRGSACFICGDIMFSGDTLFRNSFGRTDFITGSYENIKKSLKRLANLPGDYKVYCGHSDSTTLDYERKSNSLMN